jgi:hypothetical protein
MSSVQIELKYGRNPLPIPGAVAIMWRDEWHLDHVQIVIDGREWGDWSGMYETCNVWLDGWLRGFLSGAPRG